MLRFCAASIAAVLVPAMLVPAASAKELKPKFGDVDGVYYTDVAENREACRQAVQRKIYLCSQNTSFVSNTLDRKYPGCLPIFRDQSRGCADHFRSEAYKCQGSGPVRIADFTGFACTVTKTVVEEGGEPERGTGAGREQQPQTRGSAASPSPKCAAVGKGAKCWQEIANRRGCYIFVSSYHPSLKPPTWSGACAGGIAVGRGTEVWISHGASNEYTGTLVRGKRHGRWVVRWPRDGAAMEGRYLDGKRHGRWVGRWPDGTCSSDTWSHGKLVERSKC